MLLDNILTCQVYLPSPGYKVREFMYSNTLRQYPQQIWRRIKRSHASRQWEGEGRFLAGDIIEAPRCVRITVIMWTVEPGQGNGDLSSSDGRNQIRTMLVETRVKRGGRKSS